MTEHAKPLSAARQTQLFYQRRGRCKTCGDKLSHQRPQPPRPSTKTLCGWCAQTHAGYSRQFRQQRVNQGRCTQCGSAELASVRLCAGCLQSHNGRIKQLRQQRQAAGLCRDCRKPAEGYARCYWCRERQWLQRYCKRMKPVWQQRQQAYEQEQAHRQMEEVWIWHGDDWRIEYRPR